MKVVCVDDNWKLISGMDRSLPDPIKGEIYTVIRTFDALGIQFYRLKELYPDRKAFGSKHFRPISDCGEVICEWIEDTFIKEEVLKETLKQ
jgi:hypothetical protein